MSVEWLLFLVLFSSVVCKELLSLATVDSYPTLPRVFRKVHRITGKDALEVTLDEKSKEISAV